MTYNELLKTITTVMGTTHEYYDFVTSTAAKASDVVRTIIRLVLTSRLSSDSRTLSKISMKSMLGPGRR